MKAHRDLAPWLLLLCPGLPGLALAEGTPPQICIGAFSAAGVDAATATAAEDRLMAELMAAGAEVALDPNLRNADDALFSSPEALRQAVSLRDILGVLQVRVVRFGPMVRVAINTFDARSGELVDETTVMAQADGFPGSMQLRDPLGRALTALTKRNGLPPPLPTATAEDGRVDTTPIPPSPTPPPTGTGGTTVATAPPVEPPPPLATTPPTAPAPVDPWLLTGTGLAAAGGTLLVTGAVVFSLRSANYTRALRDYTYTGPSQNGGNDVTAIVDEGAYDEASFFDEALRVGGWIGVGVGAILGAGGGTLLALSLTGVLE